MIEKRLPPLNALRAFEAAARHLSVKKAAEELCVTPGAVSQMLKTLELNLGVKLFDRVNRGIFLTDIGQTYLPPVRNAFRQITEATDRVVNATDTGILTVSVTSFFASAWLVPRLDQFQRDNPEIDLRVVTSNRIVDFSREGIDVAIRHGLGIYPGLQSDRVLAVEVVPVAAPELVARLGAPVSPVDLSRWPHVHDAERKAWHRWFRAQGMEVVGPPRGPSFDDSGLLLQAVLAGQGVGLLPAAMVANELAKGQLIRVAQVALIEDFAYYLVFPESSRERPKVAAFRHWLLNAAAEKDTHGLSAGDRNHQGAAGGSL